MSGAGRVLSACDIMITVEEMEPAFLLKPGEHAVDIFMYFGDIFDFSVFPKLFPIPQLNIGKPASVIMLQRCVVQVLVLQEIIGRSADSTVTVTYKNVAGASI